jgi:small subunit ribosomal protein S20
VPLIKSAKKKARQDIKRYEANKALRSFMKNLKKKTYGIVSAAKTNSDDVKKAVDSFKSYVDKAWSKGIFKRNKSSRLKSNIDLLVTKQFSEKK